jgi:hypothetical protein
MKQKTIGVNMRFEPPLGLPANGALRMELYAEVQRDTLHGEAKNVKVIIEDKNGQALSVGIFEQDVVDPLLLKFVSGTTCILENDEIKIIKKEVV